MAREFSIAIVDESWACFGELTSLVYDVLYRDYGVPQLADWHRPASAEGAVLAALAGPHVIGTVRLIGAPDAGRVQVRQLAVRPDAQRTGVGRALVEALEDHARGCGATEIWLNARDSAFLFYERLGYSYTGDTFVSELTGIPHRPMRKVL